MTYQKKLINHDIVCADPLPDVVELREYYESKYYQDANGTTTYDAIYTEEELQHKILEADLAVMAIQQNSANRVSLLEFGCGEGFFLQQALQAGWQAHGIDFSRFGVEKWHPNLLSACSFGDSYDYLNKYILENKTFDVCALRNVLEHVLDPQGLLLDLRKILNPGGILLLTIPNDYSVLQQFALEQQHIEHDFWFQPPDHLYYFNTTNITKFVESLNYKVIDMYSSFPVDVFLLHPGSNYIKNKANGKPAHFARVNMDLLMARSGIDNLLNLYRSMAKCGVGRDITVILESDI